MKLATAARLGSTLLSLMLLALPQARAQSGTWPDKPVKIINPFPAGGASDTLVRIMADVAANPAIQKRFLDVGARLATSTPQETAAFAARERKRWGDLVRATGMKAD